MLVELRERPVVAPTNYFDEFGITTSGAPSYREPGIEGDDRPDLLGQGLPEWDLNAELLEVDPAELGRAHPAIAGRRNGQRARRPGL